MANQLSGSQSPYLRQHADNPVHWQQWSPAAFTQARERDVPVLLSVGYAACHWCHVMAHESFEDLATAEQMNANFVCIKVDREERPDVDAIYMAATVAMTGQGGWPMTCFLTPSGEPFYCGTYWPNVARGQTPAFSTVLQSMSHAWSTNRAEIDALTSRVAAHLQASTSGLPDGAEVTDAELDAAVAALAENFDETHGGFGGAPKFPPSATLEALLRDYERTGSDTAFKIATATLESMARGGIYDQLAGGFARYSVDQAWVVPHFEKMLYDNALLLRAYAHWARISGNPLARRVTDETAAFLIRDLGTTAVGEGFALTSALDADAAGEEGSTYVWRPDDLFLTLERDDVPWAARLFGITVDGTFDDGASTLQLPVDPAPAEAARFEQVRSELREVRALRDQPERDDKVVTAWNGLAITALAEAGYYDAAVACAVTVLDLHWQDHSLRRSSLDGVPGPAAGMLDDYAALVTALLTLFQTDGSQRWLGTAQEILDAAIAQFLDPDVPGSWFDAPAGSGLIARPRDAVDGATPSGTSLVAEALTLAEHLLPDAQRYRDLAAATRARAAILIRRVPQGAGHHLAVAEAATRNLQIAIAAPGRGTALELAARQLAPGGAIIVVGEPDSHPLLAGRGLVAGAPAAYVCRGSVCDLPVTEPAELRTLLTR